VAATVADGQVTITYDLATDACPSPSTDTTVDPTTPAINAPVVTPRFTG
jgi:hypothetical protein